MTPRFLTVTTAITLLLMLSVTAAAERIALYPGVARAGGANQTAWRSDAVFHNPTAAPKTLHLELLPRGSATVTASAQLQLSAGETRHIDGLYDFLHAADGAGMLRVTGDAIAWVRTFNQGAQGTFGQDLPAVDPGAGYGAGETVIFPYSTAADVKTQFRSNLVLVNLEAAPITVTLRAGGIEKTTSVPGGAYAQVDNLGGFLGTPTGPGAVLATADGRWFGVISTVDPFTGDPTTVRGLGAGETGTRLFPGVARAAGANQTAWRSEATFFNPGEEPVEVTVELVPRGGNQAAASTVLTLTAGETRRLPDVYDTLGVASGAGALRVSGAALAWVRTFNQGAQGTFGQDLPPVTESVAVGASLPVALPFRSPTNVQNDFRSNLVVQNLEARDLTVSLRAGAVEKSQVVKAGAYAQIDNLGAFLDMAPGAGTVWALADGRWAGAVSTIDPFTGDPTTLREDRAFTPPTSSALIDAALEAQTITAEQALTYKVFADFSDPRLPAGFRGDDRAVREGSAAGEAAARFGTLSPATQDLVGPYLVQPFYEGSWWDLRRVSAASAQSVAATCRPWHVACPLLTGEWEYRDSARVRVWYLKVNAATDGPIAAALGGHADNEIWPKLLPSMGLLPLPDNGEGGNDLLDVVLSDGLDSSKYADTKPTELIGCSGVPAFITLNRSISDPDIRKAVLAHEIFHAAQFAVPTRDCLYTMKWLSESTANWFENWVYPGVDREHDDAPHYLDKTHLAFDNAGGDPLKNYGGYLFFYYLTNVRGTNPAVIGQIFAQAKSMDGLHALDAALRAAGAELDESWPEFSIYALNGDSPFDAFTTLDRLMATARITGPRSGSLGAQSATWFIDSKANLVLPRLSARYYYYEFPDATTSSLAFYNGLTRSLTTITLDDYGDVYSAVELPPALQDAGGHITILRKIGGVWTEEDLTDVPARPFCRDMRDERLEALVVILSNAHIDEPSAVYPGGTYPPLLFASNIGCGPWEGEATMQYRWGQAVIESMNLTGLRLVPVVDVPYDDSTLWFRQYGPAGGDWGWSAKGSNGDCTYSGSLNGPVLNPLSTFHIIPWLVKGVGYRGLVSILPWEWTQAEMVVRESCPPPSGTRMIGWHGGEFVLTTLPEHGFARFSADGKSLTIDASTMPSRQGLTGTWHLRAKREP